MTSVVAVPLMQPQTGRLSWIPTAAAVRARNDFQEMSVRIFEIDAASAVVVIDLTFLLLARIGPVG